MTISFKYIYQHKITKSKRYEHEPISKTEFGSCDWELIFERKNTQMNNNKILKK